MSSIAIPFTFVGNSDQRALKCMNAISLSLSLCKLTFVLITSRQYQLAFAMATSIEPFTLVPGTAGISVETGTILTPGKDLL
jgi:hypothetical protein